MNLRDLRYIGAVADLGHFGRAADQCCVGQPALSGQIKKLEDYLGIAIFERTNRRVAVTPVGRDIVEKARRLLVIADDIERTAKAFADPFAGPLRLGMIPTVGPFLLPLVMKALVQALPKLDLIIVEDLTAGLEHRLADGAIDAAITATAPEIASAAEIALYVEPFQVALPVGHPLATQKNIDIGRIDPATLLLLTDGHCLADQIASACRIKRTGAAADIRATSLETLIGLVAADQGVTLLPALAVEFGGHERPGLVIRPPAKAAGRGIRIVHRAGYPRLAVLDKIADVIRSRVPKSVTIKP